MTIVLGYWLIPLVVTAALFLWTFLTPAVPASGSFYIPDLAPLFRFVLSIIGSLLVWLIYFIVLVVVR